MEDVVKNDCRIDELHTGGLKILQNKKLFCFGMDAVLLADFAMSFIQNKFSDNIARTVNGADLCTGNGIIPLLMHGSASKFNISFPLHFTAMELQDEPAELAEESVKLNRLENIISVVKGDLKESSSLFKSGIFDFITCNPPYMLPQRGRQSSNLAKMIARQEIACTLKDVLSAVYYLLKDGGEFYMIHRPERFEEIVKEIEKQGLRLEQYRFVKPFKDKEAKMVLFKCSKTEEKETPAPLEASPLIIYSQSGVYTEETEKIYGRKC